MAQNFPTILNTVKLVDSLTPLLDRGDAAASCFSGTTFPSTNLLLGQLCYRTDQLKLYQLTNLTGPVWTVIWDFSSGSVYVPFATSVAWSGVTSKPTTLSGYGITDSLNKTGDTATGKITFTASNGTRASVNVPAGTAPTSPADGDLWSTGSGLGFQISSVGYNVSFINMAETYSAKKTFVASNTSAASFNLPSGTAPTTPLDGDMWMASSQLTYRVAGVSKYVAFWDSSSRIPIANGGTGASDAATARSNLGISDVPAGLVIYTAMAYAPTGFLKANGAAVSRTTYSALFAVLGTAYGGGDGFSTFNLPDLRGEFIRGWDDARGVDSGRGFGSVQTDQMQRLQGSFRTSPYNVYAAGAFTYTSTTGSVGTGGGDRGITYFDSGGSPGARVSADTSGETRPRNIALLACIKY